MGLSRRAPALASLCLAAAAALVQGKSLPSCGFIRPCVSLGCQRNSERAGMWMASQEETSDTESAVGNPSLRTAAVPSATRVKPARGGGIGQPRRAQPPPSVEALQTETQRRRARPLSQLKRVKPKRRTSADVDEGELRPLVPKTDRESVLRGEDYWIDYRELDKQRARQEARAKAPPPDQFAQSKMRAEIANPYKQNWILFISLAIAAMVAFIRMNPDVLDDASITTFPSEL